MLRGMEVPCARRMKLKLLAVVSAALISGGCALAQKADSAIDCGAICDRYSSCFDKDYDVSACAKRCRDSASADRDFRRKADVCNACIAGRACGSATFSCGTQCASVVP